MNISRNQLKSLYKGKKEERNAKIKKGRMLKVRGKPEEALPLTLKVEDRVMSQGKQTASKFSSIV